MPTSPAPIPRGEPKRADARHNRAALLRSAAAEFAAHGPDVALDTIARTAGVSIATLYRHFPSREALVAETYRDELEQLADTDRALNTNDTAAAALASWLDSYVDYARTKRALSDVIHALPESTGGTTRDLVIGAIDRLLDAGRQDGTIRADLDALDVLATLAGLWSLPESPDWLVRATRLTEFVLSGLVAQPGRPSAAG